MFNRAGVQGFVNTDCTDSDANQIFSPSKVDVEETNFSSRNNNFPIMTNQNRMQSEGSSLFASCMDEEEKREKGKSQFVKN